MGVYLDMDPGHDDVWALAAALGTEDIWGVTVVAGNHTVDNTYRNALNVLAVLGREDIAVRKGYAAPLWVPLVIAAEIHGNTGLDGYAFAQRVVGDPDVHAVPWLASQIEAADAPVHLIATAPLTNVAALLIGYPSIREKLAGIVLMGGSLSGGNVTPYAEFNFYVDPDAADWVLGSGMPIKMVGLDVTRQAQVTLAQVEQRLGGADTEAARMLIALFRFYSRRSQGDPNRAFPLHDVLAVAAQDRPELFQWQSTPVQVQRCDPLRRGESVAIKGESERPAIEVAVGVDVSAFFDWLWQALRQAGI